MAQSDEQRIEPGGSRREFLEVLSDYDVPAYVRRGVRTENAVRHFMASCQRRRETHLEFCRMRVAQLVQRIGRNWPIVDEYAYFAADQQSDVTTPLASEYLSDLDAAWQYKLRVHVDRTDGASFIRRGLRDVARSFASFNRKWESVLNQLDFSDVNRVLEDYNNYYVCEKAAALQSEGIAAHGFERRRPLGIDDVRQSLPLLLVPSMR